MCMYYSGNMGFLYRDRGFVAVANEMPVPVPVPVRIQYIDDPSLTTPSGFSPSGFEEARSIDKLTLYSASIPTSIYYSLTFLSSLP